jgi:hypothetical protein
MFENTIQTRATAGAGIAASAAFLVFGLAGCALYFSLQPMPRVARRPVYVALVPMPIRKPLPAAARHEKAASPAKLRPRGERHPSILAAVKSAVAAAAPVAVQQAKPFRLEEPTLRNRVVGEGGQMPNFRLIEDANLLAALEAWPVKFAFSPHDLRVNQRITMWQPGSDPERLPLPYGYEARCLQNPAAFPALARIRTWAAALDGVSEEAEHACALFTVKQYQALAGKVLQALDRHLIDQPTLYWTFQGGEMYLNLKEK